MKLLSLSATVAALVLVPLLAAADGQPATDARARQRYEQGAAAFSKGDFAAAVDAFGDVYRATGETKHLWNLALAESQAGRPFDALTHLRLYVSKPDANPKNVERAGGLIADASAKIAHVTVVAPDGADILLDGARIGAAPLTAPLELDPATPHVILAQRGNDSAKQSLAPLGAATIHVALAFPVAPSASPPPPAVAVAPPPPVAPVSSSPATAPPSDARSGSGARTWVTVGLGIGALAALGGGIGMGIVSTNDANSGDQLTAQMAPGACANPNAPSCAQLAQDRNAQESAHTASIILYSGAGVLAAGAVAAFLFLPHGHSSEARGAMIPLVGPGVVGAGYVGAF